jgi:hypothetical protein
VSWSCDPAATFYWRNTCLHMCEIAYHAEISGQVGVPPPAVADPQLDRPIPRAMRPTNEALGVKVRRRSSSSRSSHATARAAVRRPGLSLVFGFSLGIVFSIGMVLRAAGQILYQTSQVLAHHDPCRHVAASLALFSSVARARGRDA